MFTVKAVNDNEGITIAVVSTIEEARDRGCLAYANEEIDGDDIVQIWIDDDDHTAVEEFGYDEC